MNNGNTTLNSVMVTVHFYDANCQLVFDSLCCCTNPTNIDPRHTATFDSFAMANEISGEPVSYRLSYDWSQYGKAKFRQVEVELRQSHNDEGTRHLFQLP